MNPSSTQSPGFSLWVKAFAIPILCWFMLLAAFLFHFYLVAKYAVDIPFWDDWFYFPIHADLSWIFAFHSEHRVPFTKFIVLVFYELNGWNIAQHQIANFVLYGLVVLSILYSLANWVPGLRKSVSAAFCTILLSPVLSENHLWATQTSWHLYLLFTIAASALLFKQDATMLTHTLGSLLLVCLMFSMAAGLVAAITILFLWTWFHFIGRSFSGKSVRCLMLEWIIVFLPFILSLMFYLNDYGRPANHAEPAPPWTMPFWEHMGGIIQIGLAGSRWITQIWPVFGVFSFAGLCGLPLFMIGKDSIHKSIGFPVGFWKLVSVTCAFFAGICLTSYGRGNYSTAAELPGRYAELSIIFIPLGAASWYWAMQRFPVMRQRLMLLLFIGFSVAHLRMAGHFRDYQRYCEQRNKELAEITNYYAVPSHRAIVFWDKVVLNPQLQEASDLRMSFFRKLMLCRPKEP